MQKDAPPLPLALLHTYPTERTKRRTHEKQHQTADQRSEGPPDRGRAGTAQRYLRLLIIHKTPTALPPADYRLLLRQMQWMETQLKELAGSQSTDENREQLDYTLQLLNSTVLLMQGAMLPRTFSPFTPNTPDGKEVNPYGGFAD